MTNIRLLAGIMALVALCSAQAQDIDLSAQRKEPQQVNAVPGVKLEHKLPIVNPSPVRYVAGQGTLDISKGFNIKGDTRGIADVLGALPQGRGASLAFAVSDKAADKASLPHNDGAYALTVTPKGIEVAARTDLGAYYAVATLLQLLESPQAEAGMLPALAITDYPEMTFRGVVEGFYGTPWSHQVRLDLIDLYGRHKMNTYIYGPKDDPFHSSPYWRQPYPEEQARKIHELAAAARKNRVNFVWAIHPGKDIRWNEADYDSLLRKFDMMYDLGVRGFAIFFDDIEGEGTNPAKQVELLNRLNREFVIPKGDVQNLMICPTEYSRSWANPTEDGSLAYYGRNLDKNIEVFYTGDAVCSDLTAETMEFFDPLIQRPGLYWWNFPVSDYCRNYILQGPAYGLDTTLTVNEVSGVVSNPMEHGEASRLALYGVADYTWNPRAYNPMDNWERAIVEMLPDAARAYRTFAIHSADTETGYRRDESWETVTFPILEGTPEQVVALRDEFSRIIEAPALIRASKSNPALVAEIEPWLVEFEKLGLRGNGVLDLLGYYKSGDEATFWDAYRALIMDDEASKAYVAHKSGTLRLQPFYENAMTDLLAAYYTSVGGSGMRYRRGIGSFPNIYTNLDGLMLDGDLSTYYTSALSQRPGDWIGVDLGTVMPINDITIRQGRNSKDDVDYFERAILEVSSDGNTWAALTDSLEYQYDIDWEGSDVEGRYVRLRRLDSPKRNWASVRIFDVNRPRPTDSGFEIYVPQDATPLTGAFDRDPQTSARIDGTVRMRVPQGVSTLVFLLGEPSGNAMIMLQDKSGNAIETVEVDKSYVSVPLTPETASVRIDGPIEVYEVIGK